MGRLLFLSSAGLPKETRNFCLEVLPKKPAELKVAFIPTAADLDENKWYVTSARDELNELGFKIEDVDLKIDPNILKEKLNSSDIIYINGGNTFYLLEWVRKSGLDKYLNDLIDKGNIFISGSAGSIIMGPNIELAGWDPSWDSNLNNLEDLTGLKIVDFAISPHFTESERKVLESGKKKINYEIIPITDQQAILVQGDNHRIVGSGAVVKLN